MLSCTIAVILLSFLVNCHVILDFPAARQPQFDFLDTFRTPTPCGVPKSGEAGQCLLTGTEINVTWRMNYRHRGGYQMVLLDRNSRLVSYLAGSANTFDGADDNWRSRAVVQLPETVCYGCTIRLLRQALEWGQSYRFQSCADIDLVSPASVADAASAQFCSDHGVYKSSDGTCECREQFTGERCEFKTSCKDDSDCGQNGKCEEMYHGMVCFCAAPFFGEFCEFGTESSPADGCFNYQQSTTDDLFDSYNFFNSACYNTLQLNPTDNLWYRFIGDEIEVILGYESTSWIALGWRNASETANCHLFPQLPIGPNSNDLQDAQVFYNSYLHGMECLDMVVVSVRDGRSWVEDRYSRDRSTPLADRQLGGSDNHIAAAAIQRDGRTLAMFRRLIISSEPTDVSFGFDRMHFAWAKGQTTQTDYYTEGVPMYHGRNRGYILGTLEMSPALTMDQGSADVPVENQDQSPARVDSPPVPSDESLDHMRSAAGAEMKDVVKDVMEIPQFRPFLPIIKFLFG